MFNVVILSVAFVAIGTEIPLELALVVYFKAVVVLRMPAYLAVGIDR